MQTLKENFDAVRASIGALDQAIARTINELTTEREDALRDLRNELESKIAEAREDVEAIRREAEESLELAEAVKAGQKGVLDTSSLPLKMLYDKLAERWENLSAFELQIIEEVLDGNVVKI